jgi:hypothetical protein
MIEYVLRELMIILLTSIGIITWLWLWERVDYYFLCPERRIARLTQDWSYFAQYRPWNMKEIITDLFFKEWWRVIVFVVIVDSIAFAFSNGRFTPVTNLVMSLF